MKEYTVLNLQDGNDNFSIIAEDIMEAMLYALNQLGYNISQENYDICDICYKEEAYTKCESCDRCICTDCMKKRNDSYYCEDCY